MSQQQTALIFGATGAVGKQLLKDLLENSKYNKIVSLGRRNVQLEDSVPQEKLVQKTIDFENLEASREDFKNVSDVYCCLGTTRADAGGAEQFKKIDQTYVLNSAKLIVEENRPNETALAPVHFLYCSASNANANSYFLYPKTKGETERGLEEAGFEKVSIFRPGFLDIVEERTRPRLAERVAASIYMPIDKFFGLGTSISVITVGKAMHKVAENASIEPTEKKTSKIGSLVSIFSNGATEKIGNPKN